jgi:hypothetical protein
LRTMLSFVEEASDPKVGPLLGPML